MLKESTFTTQLGDQTITLSTGKVAQQAGGAVIVQSGETVLLATATMSHSVREGLDFFPLTVDFEERLYAAGRIPGSYFRREGRPSEKAILTSRLVDRPIRPLFPDGMRNEVQVVLVALSQGVEIHADTLAVVAASAALTISDIPFAGPVGAVRVGHIDGELVINPTIPQMANSDLDLRIAGSADAIIMVEAGSNEVSEALMVEAIELAHQSIQGVIQTQLEMQQAVGKPKSAYEVAKLPEGVAERVGELVRDKIKSLLETTQLKGERIEALNALEEELHVALAEDMESLGWTSKDIGEAFHNEVKNIIRERILDAGIRPDGRDQRTIRPLDAEVSLLPRPHGSGLFTRGETQVLSLTTLGMPGEEQTFDDLFPEETKSYIHHYNFPPYSTGEVSPMRGPKRREIGHGALAERALVPVLP
ncbi:MAG: polyribonucleotide nucleotidyltransferase, partial [Anaerolineae bacterium]|nr:polyribonucleotide nucleotidyltransferase [Anaerolineae bacterium]